MKLQKIREKKKNRIRNRLIFRSVILAVLLGAIVFVIVTNAKQDHTIYKVGDQAPDFQLTQVNENNQLETIQLSDLEGKGVMLNFWATFCGPCEAEMPHMEKLYADYKEKGIEIVAVNLGESELAVNRFIDKHNLSFPVPLDKQGQVSDLYKIGPMPTSYFVNPEGEIIEKIEGALTLERLEDYFKQILPE